MNPATDPFLKDLQSFLDQLMTFFTDFFHQLLAAFLF